MKTRILFFSLVMVAVVGGCVLFIFARPSSPSQPIPEPDIKATLVGDTTSGINVLEDALAINGPDAPKPPSTFRPGHVTEGTVPTHVTNTDYGFYISVGSASQVPTPSIHDGRIFVGGGFGSKVFHCFATGNGDRIWSKDLDDDGPSSAVMEDGVVVFNTESCTLFACDEKTGDPKWSWYLGDPLMSMPTISKGRVFTTYPAPYGYSSSRTETNELNNLNQNNSEAIPSQKPAPEIKARIHPDHVFAAFDLQSGKVLWQKWVDGDALSAPVVNGDELLLVTFPGTIWRFRQSDGEILSVVAAHATSAPVVVNGNVFYTSRSDKNGVVGEAMSNSTMNDLVVSATGHTKNAEYLDSKVQDKTALKTTAATQDAGNGFSAGAPASSGYEGALSNIGQSNVSSLQAFQGSRMLNYQGKNYSLMGDELLCVDEHSGVAEWSKKLSGDLQSSGGFLGTPPLATNGRLIVATLEGDVVIYEAGSGKEIQRIKTGEAIRQQPVADSGWIYASTTDGKILAIRTNDPAITGWPVWGGDVGHSGVPVK